LINIGHGKEKIMNPQEQHEYDVAMQNKHQHFYENIPLYKPQILELLNAVKKKKPELVVVKGERPYTMFVDQTTKMTVYRELELAYANLPTQVVGAIGFDGESYYVYSRLVENAKFSAWNSRDYHTKKSKHMNNIVKEALKYLLPTQLKEVISESVQGFEQHIHKIRDNAVHSMRAKLNGLNSQMRDELFHMVEQGYKPKNACFASAMTYVVETKEEYERNQNYNPERAFVWVKPDCVVYQRFKADPISVASTDDLPEEIRGKLFVLMVSDTNNFIDEVGMKAGDNKFWVML
jgi:hypothetical protein